MNAVTKEIQVQMRILGIETFPFTLAELKAKYRTMCLKNHPDLCNLPDAESRMKLINIVYSNLKNLAIENNNDLFNITKYYSVRSNRGNSTTYKVNVVA